MDFGGRQQPAVLQNAKRPADLVENLLASASRKPGARVELVLE